MISATTPPPTHFLNSPPTTPLTRYLRWRDACLVALMVNMAGYMISVRNHQVKSAD